MKDGSGFRSRDISETKSSSDGLNARTDGGQLAYAQTIPPSALTSLTGTLSFTNTLPKSSIAILHPRRIFLEMGLFSGLFNSEVSDYIAVVNSRRGRKAFVEESPQAAPVVRFSLFGQ